MNQPTSDNAVEYDELSTEHQAEAIKVFGTGKPMTNYTYAVHSDGRMCHWRYYKPSYECMHMIEHVLTAK